MELCNLDFKSPQVLTLNHKYTVGIEHYEYKQEFNKLTKAKTKICLIGPNH